MIHTVMLLKILQYPRLFDSNIDNILTDTYNTFLVCYIRIILYVKAPEISVTRGQAE